MKKLLSIAFLAMVVMAFAACKKTYVTNVTPNKVYNVSINASSWALSSDGKSYTVTVEADAIDDFFNDNGATLVYFSFDGGTTYEQIPEVYNGNSFSYIHSVDNDGGYLTFYAQSPVAGQPPVKPTDNVSVKLVLVPAE